MKTLLRVLAEREQITESALVRQLLEVMLRMSAKEGFPKLDALEKVSRDARLSIRLAPEDRILLSDRATARGMASATYVSVLVRSHLRNLAPLPKEELLALKRSVAELGAIGRNLNQIARAANQGGKPRWTWTRGSQGNAEGGGSASRPRKGAAESQSDLMGAAGMPRRVIDVGREPGMLLDIASYARRGPGRRDRLPQDEIELIARTVRRTPEVMVKVLSRGGQDLKSIRSSSRLPESRRRGGHRDRRWSAPFG